MNKLKTVEEIRKEFELENQTIMTADETFEYLKEQFRKLVTEAVFGAIEKAEVGKPQQASDERIYDIKCMMLKELKDAIIPQIRAKLKEAGLI